MRREVNKGIRSVGDSTAETTNIVWFCGWSLFIEGVERTIAADSHKWKCLVMGQHSVGLSN